jgi:hypothetical protein
LLEIKNVKYIFTFYRLRTNIPESKFLVTKFEFGGIFGMSLEEDCNEVKFNSNLELFITFGENLSGA